MPSSSPGTRQMVAIFEAMPVPTRSSSSSSTLGRPWPQLPPPRRDRLIFSTLPFSLFLPSSTTSGRPNPSALLPRCSPVGRCCRSVDRADAKLVSVLYARPPTPATKTTSWMLVRAVWTTKPSLRHALTSSPASQTSWTAPRLVHIVPVEYTARCIVHIIHLVFLSRVSGHCT
jgi:hypothetical protein